MKEHTTITLQGTDLSSRISAAYQRERIYKILLRNKKVIVSFPEAESVASSYADELFGVLAAYHGFDWLSEHIKVKTKNSYVLRSIAEAIQRRLHEAGKRAA